MLELSLLGTVFLILGLAPVDGADSDDDDRSGGLRQPVLVPIPVRSSTGAEPSQLNHSKPGVNSAPAFLMACRQPKRIPQGNVALLRHY